MSEEKRAMLEALLEELWNNYEEVQEEWIDGYIDYDEAVSAQKSIESDIREVHELLNE